jgi:UDP-GlcNAc:undecaprenyl-phosphate/decaprenyl-phosphate GlcNAc-1-phosphate transferase
MLLPLLFFGFGLISTWLMTPAVIALAHRLGVLDQPGERKVHDHPVPRLGGLAIYGTFAVASLGAVGIHGRIHESFLASRPFWESLAVGGTLVFLLGLYDDFRHASIWTKFIVQFGAAGVVMGWGGVRILKFANPFGDPIVLGWLWIPLTALWIVGVTNALNLIDGLDGLAGGVSFISVVTLFTISLIQGERLLVVLTTAVLAGALLGFLKYNFHPARIFLGDCGSMFLGYLLAVLSIMGTSKRTTALALLIPILLLGIPIFDTLNAMGRRLLRRVVYEGQWKPSALLAMFSADRAHIHHMLLSLGYTHRRTVLILYGLSLICGLLAVVAVVADNDRVSLGLIIAGFACFVLMKQFGWARIFGHGPGSGDNEEK